MAIYSYTLGSSSPWKNVNMAPADVHTARRWTLESGPYVSFCTCSQLLRRESTFMAQKNAARTLEKRNWATPSLLTGLRFFFIYFCKTIISLNHHLFTGTMTQAVWKCSLLKKNSGNVTELIPLNICRTRPTQRQGVTKRKIRE